MRLFVSWLHRFASSGTSRGLTVSQKLRRSNPLERYATWVYFPASTGGAKFKEITLCTDTGRPFME
jgi:hypothetical protein